MTFNITQLENVEIDLKVVESGLLLKPIKKNRRVDLAKNINQILENSKNKEDKALLKDFLDDSDLQDLNGRKKRTSKKSCDNAL